MYKGLLDNGEFIAVKELDLPDYVDPKTELVRNKLSHFYLYMLMIISNIDHLNKKKNC